MKTLPMILVILIKICLNEISGRVRVGKYLSDMFSIKHDLKQRDVSLLLFSFPLEYVVGQAQAILFVSP